MRRQNGKKQGIQLLCLRWIESHTTHRISALCGSHHVWPSVEMSLCDVPQGSRTLVVWHGKFTYVSWFQGEGVMFSKLCSPNQVMGDIAPSVSALLLVSSCFAPKRFFSSGIPGTVGGSSEGVMYGWKLESRVLEEDLGQLSDKQCGMIGLTEAEPQKFVPNQQCGWLVVPAKKALVKEKEYSTTKVLKFKAT